MQEDLISLNVDFFPVIKSVKGFMSQIWGISMLTPLFAYLNVVM